MNWIPKPESELFICYHEGWTFEQTHDGVRISGWGREAFLPMGEFSEKKLLLMTKNTESALLDCQADNNLIQ